MCYRLTLTKFLEECKIALTTCQTGRWKYELPPFSRGAYKLIVVKHHQKVMSTSLGPNWMNNFQEFDRVPFAAASIGQVHAATLASEASPTGSPARVAVKVQFPNIVHSIDSDLGYIKLLLTAGRLLPKGLFLDRTVQVMLRLYTFLVNGY
jgi:hypothetical protein